MIDYTLLVFRRWLDFRGRSRRSEYWYFTLSCLIVSIVLAAIEGAMGIGDGTALEDAGNGPLSILFSLVTLVPGIAVSFRRIHDVGRSAWWLLLWLIPIIGWAVLLFWSIRDGDPNRNEYGPDPKRPDEGVSDAFN
jgi:uncharacterized membrane protein YhaH (DUF805 family)